jgi:hypothetical protein
MRVTAAFLLLTTALGGVSAHPSAHRHEHQHTKLAAAELTVVADSQPIPQPVDSSPIEIRAPAPMKFLKGSKPKKATPTPTPTPTPLPQTAAASAYQPFCGGKTKRATLGQIAYAGNTGVPGNWGCNIMQIDASISGLYDYTAKFSAPTGAYTCVCFNKIGPSGLIDGFWNSALQFTVAKGGSQWIAFDKNSQGGCACGPGSGAVPKTSWGQWAGTWLEFDWGNTSNGGNSGADASVLVAGAGGLPYYGMSVAANGKMCSWVKSNGQNHEAYMPGDEDKDGVGCKGYYKGSLDIVLGD